MQFVQTARQAQHDPDHLLQLFTSTARENRCPLRYAAFHDNTEDADLFKRHRFLSFRMGGSFMCFDFHSPQQFPLPSHLADPLSYVKPSSSSSSSSSASSYSLFELESDCTPSCANLQRDWGRVLAQSFSMNEAAQAFYADTWKHVPVGRGKPIRMFVCQRRRKDAGEGEHEEVVGGAQVSYADGVAVVFNVVTRASERGRGLGTALTVATMQAAREDGIRWCLLQASAAGRPTYTKLGFKPIPGGEEVVTYVKLSTASWWCGVKEPVVRLLGPDMGLIRGDRIAWAKAFAKLIPVFCTVLLFLYAVARVLF